MYGGGIIETSGKCMLESLFNFYIENTNYLPPEYRVENVFRQYGDVYKNEREDSGLQEMLQKRLVIDYISGMMDEYVKTSYNRLIK